MKPGDMERDISLYISRDVGKMGSGALDDPPPPFFWGGGGIFHTFPVFEIKHIFCAHTGCRRTHNHAPGDFSLCTCLCNV